MFGYAGSSPLHGFSLIVVLRLLIAVAPLVVEHRLQGTRASVVATPGLWSTGSAVVVQGLNLLRGIWDLQAGFEPESPALTGEFFTTEPPGKPQYTFLCKWWFSTREGFAFSPSLLGNIWQWQETVFIVIVGSGGGVLLVWFSGSKTTPKGWKLVPGGFFFLSLTLLICVKHKYTYRT